MKFYKQGALPGLLAGALGLPLAALAQAVPDAGSVRQQIEQVRPLPLPAAPAPAPAAAVPQAKSPTGATIRVKRFRLAGHTLVATETLMAALAGFTDQDLDLPALQRAADAVAAVYRREGWLALVHLPEQDAAQGEVLLQVVEARFGGVRPEGPPPALVRRQVIESMFLQQQAVGAPLNVNAVDRALLLVDDLPGVSVSGTLVPGAREGETALALQTSDEPRVHGQVGLDNTGSRSTGSERLTASLNINSPGGYGELVSLSVLHSQGSEYGRLAIMVPVGTSGLRAGVNASSMRYRVVGGPDSIRNLGIRGRSSSMGLDWSYPLVRSRTGNLQLTGGADLKHFFSHNNNTNPTDAKSFSDYDSETMRIGLSGSAFDTWGGGGANGASVQLLWGELPTVRAHSQIDALRRNFAKLSYSASRQQTVSAQHSLLLSLQGQHAHQVLDSSERFYIGGPGTVRAYPVSELGGERGQVLSAEWRWRVTATATLSAFVDHGRVVSLPISAGDTVSKLVLSGHGLSAGWQGPGGLNLRLTWAQRHGTHPKPTSTGTDADGTRQIDRWWFTAGLPF